MRPERKAFLAQHPGSGLASWGREGWAWVQAHKRTVGIGGGGVIGVLVCWAALTVYGGYQHTIGLRELRTGIESLHDGALDNAVTHLRQAAEHCFDGTVRQLAFFQLGEAYQRQGREDAARQAYEAVLSSGNREHYLVQLALLELGQAAENQGDLERARERYTQAAALNGPAKPEALLAAARIIERVNDQSESQSYYEQFLAQYPNSPLASVVREKVGQ